MKINKWALPLYQTKWSRAYIKGGRWSSKSQEVAHYVACTMRRYSGTFACCRQFQNSIDQSCFSLLKDIIINEGWSHLFHITSRTIVSKETGAIAVFMGLERNAQSVKSQNNIRLLWIEEANYVNEESYTLVLPSVRANGAQMIFTWNPQYEEDYIETMCNNRADDDLCLHINYADNAFLNEAFHKEYADSIRRNPELEQHIWYGAYRPATASNPFGAKLIDAAVDRDFITPVPIPETVVGVDVAYSSDGDYTALVKMDTAGNVLSAHHFREEDADARASMIQSLCEGTSYILIDCTEAAGKTVYQHLRKRGYPAREFFFSRKSKTEIVTTLADRFLEGKVSITNQPELVRELKLFGSDGKGKYEAVRGHDDLVCAMLLASECLRRWRR